MENWISKELSRLLRLEADAEDLVDYIMTMESKKDLEDYLSDIMDLDNFYHREFINSLMQRWTPRQRPVSQVIPDSAFVYQKKGTPESFVPEKSDRVEKQILPKQEVFPPSKNKMSDDDTETAISQLVLDAKSKNAKKKKSKFVNLFGADGAAALTAKLPGRHACECLATKHKLVNNCISCGRIVCEQEGSGPCLFCGKLVCTKEEEEVLRRGSKKSEKLRTELLEKGGGGVDGGSCASISEDLQRATQHRDKLLEFDRTSVKRTKVIDDQSDYFASDTNRWLSDNERKKLKAREDQLREQRHASRRQRKVTLDLYGRRVIEDTTPDNMYDREDAVVQEVHYSGPPSEKRRTEFDQEYINDLLINPALHHTQQAAPRYVDVAAGDDTPTRPSYSTAAAKKQAAKTMRIQDSELQQMSDSGMCLSMHQPWASLLVRGIKRHEGRTWYSPHRGRLWIAATAQQVDANEAVAIETEYIKRNEGRFCDYPESYPTGCLLGCVEVEDCLEQEKYRLEFPDGESSSPYVFICKNPQELLVKFPMKGKHKIYKLDAHLHQLAKKGRYMVTES